MYVYVCIYNQHRSPFQTGLIGQTTMTGKERKDIDLNRTKTRR